jgi:hypothetical protein
VADESGLDEMWQLKRAGRVVAVEVGWTRCGSRLEELKVEASC